MQITKRTNTNATTSSPNRDIKYLVYHYTAGVSSKKGKALGTADWFANPNAGGSADFIVDDELIVQYNPDPKNRYCWAVGGSKYSSMTTNLGGQFYGKCTNKNSISIEICSNKTNTNSLSASDSDWYFTEAELDKAIELGKYLMKLYNIPIDRVIMHHQVTGKVCPNPWVLNNSRLDGWYEFRNRLVDGKSNSISQSSSNNTTTTAKNKIPNAPFKVKVIISDLYYRSEPNGKKIAYTGKGLFTITEVKNGWGKLKSGAGWIYLENPSYVKIDSTLNESTSKSNTTSSSKKVRVTADKLFIRKGPGTNYDKNGSITDKGTYTIVDTSPGKGSDKGWGKLKSGAGWISLDFVKNV